MADKAVHVTANVVNKVAHVTANVVEVTYIKPTPEAILNSDFIVSMVLMSKVGGAYHRVTVQFTLQTILNAILDGGGKRMRFYVGETSDDIVVVETAEVMQYLESSGALEAFDEWEVTTYV